MSFHVNVEPPSVPRYPSMAPRYTSPVLSGGAATYQSYQAWLTSNPAGVAIFVHAVPDLRHRYALLPAAPKTYATSGAVRTRSTASRVHAVAGAPGSATAANELPPLVDAKRPSAKVARSSIDPPFG